jgi:hypothetical protein
VTSASSNLGLIGLPRPLKELAAATWDAIIVGAGHNGLTCAACRDYKPTISIQPTPVRRVGEGGTHRPATSRMKPVNDSGDDKEPLRWAAERLQCVNWQGAYFNVRAFIASTIPLPK